MKRLIALFILLLPVSVLGDLTGTEGLAIDLSSAGAGTDFTIAFDPTEITGGTTWDDAGEASVVWTWNLTAGDPQISFGNTTISLLAATTHLGVDNTIGSLELHDIGTIKLWDDGDDTSVILGPVGDGTTTLGVTGTINATGLQVGGSAVLTAVTADSPLSGSGTGASHLVIASAAADGATLGAAAFNALDFEAAAGVIALDRTATIAANPALGANNLVFSTTGLIFEGSTNDNIETLITVTDPADADKTITFPNATGTVAVSATTPITLSAAGDIGHATTSGNVHIPADGAAAQILQYTAAGTAKWITVSSDATIADNGAVTVANDSHDHSAAGSTVTVAAADITDQNAGTDITADLEEETHASEHVVSAADTVFPADPAADRYLMWDDDPGALVWDAGPGVADTAWDAIVDPAGAGEVAFANTTQELSMGVSGAFQVGDGGGANYVQIVSTGALTFAGTASIDVPAKSIVAADLADADFGAFTVADGVAALDVDYEEEVTEGSLADSTIVSADIKDATIAGGDLAANIAITSTGVQNYGGAASFEIPNGTDPDLTVMGQLSVDSDGANEVNDVVLRVTDTGGDTQYALAEVIRTVQATIVKPNDLADATRDACIIWSNETGMSFVVTKIEAWSGTDDTTLNVEETDADGANNATVDALEIATNGTGLFYATETAITAATIEANHVLWLDFDDTDDPAWVKVSICGYFIADVD